MMFGTELPKNIPDVSKIYKVRDGEAICKTFPHQSWPLQK